MSKPIVSESRFDFRGGRNTAISPDLLNPNELVDCTNARISQVYGGVTKRSGTQRIHQTALGNINTPNNFLINGVTQWDGPSGKQVVVIVDGDLYYRNGFTYSTAFTRVASNLFAVDVSTPAFFMPFRAQTAGAPLILFIASGGKLFTWDGAGTLTRIDGVAGAPTADRIIAYHTRGFAHEPTLLKHIWWSRIGDATNWSPLTKSDGGSALVDVLNGESIVALEVIGSSLLMATNDCVMRFTGHASDDIVIAQDTEGVSSEVGCVGPQALKRFENVAGMLSSRGPYAVTETYVEPIGEQIGPDFTDLVSGTNGSFLSQAVVAYNRSRKELTYFVSRSADAGFNKSAFTQSVRLQAWQGPWVYPFTTNCASIYFDANNNATLISGSNDGFVRLMDVGTLDDVLFDGSGGSNIAMTVEFPVMHFQSPGTKKQLKWLIMQADLPIGSSPSVEFSFDGAAFTPITITPNDNGEEDYRVDVAGATQQGFRCRMRFKDSSALAPTLNGFSLIGWDYKRTT